MNRTSLATAIATLAVSASLLGSPLGANANAGDPAPIPQPQPADGDRRDVAEHTDVVLLDHPVALDAALKVVASKPVTELRVAGTNFGGALVLSPTIEENVANSLRYPRSFTADSGAEPAVTQFTIRGATTAQTERLKRQLQVLPKQPLESASSAFGPTGELTTTLKEQIRNQRSRSRGGSSVGSLSKLTELPEAVSQTTPTDDFTLDNFENAYPSAAFSEMAEVIPGSTMSYNFSIGFTWDYVPEVGVLHHTQLWPDDWGLEIGPTMYNGDLSEQPRPLCGFDGGDSDTDFFFETFSSSADDSSFFTVWNVPSEAEPYVDSEITFDACDENSLELGIGKPRELDNNVAYYAVAWMTRGTKEDSLVGATMSAKTNDCNNLGLNASTECMGLNTGAVPEYIVPYELLLNRDRELTAPLAFKMTDYWDQPFVLDPLVCPSIWCG